MKRKKTDRQIKDGQLREIREIIFASLYTIIKTKLMISFYWGKIKIEADDGIYEVSMYL